MQRSSAFGFLYVLIAGVITLVLSYLTGTNGIELFIVAAVSTFFLLVWFSIQLLKHLFFMKTWLIAKIILTASMLALIFVASVMALGSLPLQRDNTVNGWLVLLGIAPFIIPRLGVYRTFKDPNRLGIGLIITFLSLIILFMASAGFRNSDEAYKDILLVVTVQLQFIFTYIALQTNYLEYSRSKVLAWLERRSIVDEQLQMRVLLMTTGLPFIIPIAIVFFLSF